MGLKDNDWQRPVYTDNFDRRQFTPQSKEDILRGFVELVKNSCDSYERKYKGGEYKDATITIKYGSFMEKKNKQFHITDLAEGMDYNQFNKALGVGAKTSGLNEISTVTGSQGFGLKEACWGFSTAKIYSIKDNKITICEFSNTDTPLWRWVKKDEVVTKEERELTHISLNGTHIEGTLPPNNIFSHPRVNTVYDCLCKNYLLRKINTSPKFNILFYDLEDLTSTPKRIFHIYPEGSLKREGNYSFNMDKYGLFECQYKIYLTNSIILESFGDSRENGLLIYYSEFSILDNCLLGFDNHRLANRVFGEIKINGPVNKMLDNNERIFGERRKGLYTDHEFYKKISGGIMSILDSFLSTELRNLYDRSRDVSKNTVENINTLLREMNRIFKDETKEDKPIDVPNDKYRPKNGFSFCDYDFLTITEFEPKSVHLVADMDVIPDNSKVKIVTDIADIKIIPSDLEFKKSDGNERGICKKKIILYSEFADVEGKISAQVLDTLKTAELLIKVKENPKLHFEGNLAFIPNEREIVDRERELITLIIKNNTIKSGNEIKLSSDGNILEFYDTIVVSKETVHKITENISELSISITGRGVGKKTTLKAEFNNESTILNIEVVSKSEQKFRGYFKGIEEKDDEGTKELGHYDKGIIYVHTDHPMVKHYRNLTNYEENPSYRTFYADIIVRIFVDQLTRRKLVDFSKGEAAREQYLAKFDEYYHLYSPKLHPFVVSLDNIEKFKTKKS